MRRILIMRTRIIAIFVAIADRITIVATKDLAQGFGPLDGEKAARWHRAACARRNYFLFPRLLPPIVVSVVHRIDQTGIESTAHSLAHSLIIVVSLSNAPTHTPTHLQNTHTMASASASSGSWAGPVQLDDCPTIAPFFGFMGVSSALVLANIGAAYGTAKSGIGIASMGVMSPGLVMRNIIPVVMAGVLGIYGLIVAVIIQGAITAPVNGMGKYSLYSGFAHMCAGMCCGFSGLGAGMAIGIVGDSGVRAVGQQEKLFVGLILVLIFAEALGLYGLIVALILSQNSYTC